MQRCRECEIILQEGRNWHASYAARNYRHCMECARAYSRQRYGKLKPTVKRRVPAAGIVARTPMTARDRAVRNRAELARQRRDRPD
jgi:hypothetical protein